MDAEEVFLSGNKIKVIREETGNWTGLKVCIHIVMGHLAIYVGCCFYSDQKVSELLKQ